MWNRQRPSLKAPPVGWRSTMQPGKGTGSDPSRKVRLDAGIPPTKSDTPTMQISTQTQLVDVVRMLSRRRWLILGMGAWGAAMAGIVAFILPPKYTAKAHIVIESQAAAGGQSNAPDTVSESEIETHVTSIASRNHLQRVLDSIVAGQGSPPALPDTPAGPDPAAGKAFASQAKDQLPVQNWLPSLDGMEQGFRAFQERKSRVIAVTYTSTNPVMSAAIANQVATLYVERQVDRRQVEKGTVLVDQQLAGLTHQLFLAKSEVASRQERLTLLRGLQSRHGGHDALIEALDSSALSDFHRERTALLKSRTELAAAHNDAHPSVLSIAAKLHDVGERISREIDRLMTQLENEAQISGARVRALEQRLATMRAAQSEARGAQPRLHEPLLEAATAADFYGNLLSRQRVTPPEQTIMSAGVRVVTIADAPSVPSSFNPYVLVVPALIAFSIAGALLAAIVEGLDLALRREGDVSDALGISCIGLVPRLPAPARMRLRPLLLRKPIDGVGEANSSLLDAARRLGEAVLSRRLLTNPFAAFTTAIASFRAALQRRRPGEPESYRLLLNSPHAAYTESIRQVVVGALQLPAPKSAPKVILITSSVPGEGKTTLAVSFAIYAARLKRRVLLIDLAVKGPAVLSELRGTAEKGIIDVLQGLPLEEAIQHVPEWSLDYLPLPGDPVDPLVMLGGDSLSDVLGRLREKYDCVVIDSTAVLGSTETRVLASMADKVLFAVKWGSTRRDIAQDAVNVLRGPDRPESPRARSISGVVTQVDLKKHARYV